MPATVSLIPVFRLKPILLTPPALPHKSFVLHELDIVKGFGVGEGTLTFSRTVFLSRVTEGIANMNLSQPFNLSFI